MSKVIKVGYAIYPSVKLRLPKFNAKKGIEEMVFAKELLFGDYIKPQVVNGDYVRKVVVEKEKEVEYIQVRSRNMDGYIKESEIQVERPLEVNFVDVGQGDGCHIVTPDDKHFIVDAGESDNMYRFLKWRFNIGTSKTAPPPFTIVISHPDADHYAGFTKIFEKTPKAAQQFKIEKVYHNGMVEGSGGVDTLGTYYKVKRGENYITDLCDTQEDYKKRVADKSVKHGDYINLLEKTEADKQALRAGMDPIYDKDGLKIEVKGPFAETINGKAALPVFGGDKGMTKNGHSIILKLTMGHIRILLGGDLNTDSEYYLIRKYSGVDIPAVQKELSLKKTKAERKTVLEGQLEDAITLTRQELEVDIAKSCHHGSADFTSDFLRVLNPIVTVISSGDNEPHVHPRPDTLGTIGKFSRGERSLIFSTELARSGKEFVELDKIQSDDVKRERAVTVYGMINVRTDGNRAIIAQKLESPAANRGWDIHKLEWREAKREFEYIME